MKYTECAFWCLSLAPCYKSLMKKNIYIFFSCVCDYSSLWIQGREIKYSLTESESLFIKSSVEPKRVAFIS